MIKLPSYFILVLSLMSGALTPPLLTAAAPEAAGERVSSDLNPRTVLVLVNRYLAFAALGLQDALTLCSVCQAWQDAVDNYASQMWMQIAADDRRGSVSLETLVRHRNYPLVKRLLASYIYLNLPLPTRILNQAVEINCVDIAKLLIANGVEVNTPNFSGKLPLDCVMDSGQQINDRHKEIATSLIKAGADINSPRPCRKGRNPLQWAVSYGLTEWVRFLINAGADVRVIDGRNKNLLHIALENKHWDIVRMLIADGRFNINARTGLGDTPLHLATEHGNAPIAERLIRAGASVHATNGEGYTPLHLAAEMGHHEIAGLLICEGAGVNAKVRISEYTCTPLFLAVRGFESDGGGLSSEELRVRRRRFLAVADVLHRFGANVHETVQVINRPYRTTLVVSIFDYARKAYLWKMVDLLSRSPRALIYPSSF